MTEQNFRVDRRTLCKLMGSAGLIEKGIRSVKPPANIVAWDWSWGIIEDDPQPQIIARVPRTVTLMVDFERGTPITRDGATAKVDEYSLSTPGPSPRAAGHIRQAREQGMCVIAKAQVGNTWELGLLPFIPVPHLVARKFAAIRAEGVSGAMESWTLGAYPSLNWQVAERSYAAAPANIDSAVREVALERYGKAAADTVTETWRIFAETFKQYPFSNSQVYSSVVQNGPAQPWCLRPSGKTPRILNSYDDLRWTAPYGPDCVARIFESMAEQWRRGVDQFAAALERVPASLRPEAMRDLRISRAVWLYFRSISNQVAFHSGATLGPRSRRCCGMKSRSPANFCKSAAPTLTSGLKPPCNTFTAAGRARENRVLPLYVA